MTTDNLFQDRYEAGLQLAKLVIKTQPVNPIVYGIPRGGVIVAAAIARQLGCPLDVAIAKKIVLPSYPETAIGAVTVDGYILDLGKEHCTENEWNQAVQQAYSKAKGLLSVFAPFRPQLEVSGATAILVDDGIATGATIAAIAAGMQNIPYQEIWVVVPVAPHTIPSVLTPYIDRVILLADPVVFRSVSCFYRNFPEVSTAQSLACFREIK